MSSKRTMHPLPKISSQLSRKPLQLLIPSSLLTAPSLHCSFTAVSSLIHCSCKLSFHGSVPPLVWVDTAVTPSTAYRTGAHHVIHHIVYRCSPRYSAHPVISQLATSPRGPRRKPGASASTLTRLSPLLATSPYINTPLIGYLCTREPRAPHIALRIQRGAPFAPRI
jgi:hypothetical protein